MTGTMHMKLPFFVRRLDEDGDILSADLKTKPRQLLQLWQNWRDADQRVPRKSAIDPIALGKAGLMPDSWLIGMTDDGRFRFTLAGENTNNMFDFGLRGKTVEETFDPVTAAFANYRYGRIIHDECAEFSRGPVTRNGKLCYYAHRLILPLRNEDGDGAFAIGVAQTEDMDPFVDRSSPLEFFFDQIVLTPASRL